MLLPPRYVEALVPAPEAGFQRGTLVMQPADNQLSALVAVAGFSRKKSRTEFQSAIRLQTSGSAEIENRFFRWNDVTI